MTDAVYVNGCRVGVIINESPRFVCVEWSGGGNHWIARDALSWGGVPLTVMAADHDPGDEDRS